MGTVRVSSRVAAAVATALGIGAPTQWASAQVMAEDGTPLEEIIVTATRRPVSVQDIPFNIVALSPEALQQLRVTNLDGLVRMVPGLYLPNQGPRSSNLLTVRGLNVTSLNASESLGNGSGGTVATYLGDIPLFVDLTMIDVERVEALLGPQGTLYGAGTLGGAIRYLPNRPSTEGMEADVGGRVYSLNESDGMGAYVHGMVNVPLIQDRLALRVAAGYLDDPGFVDYDYIVRNPGTSNPQPDFSDPDDVKANLRKVKDADSEETLTARIGLLWQVTDDLDANLTYYYQDEQVGARTVNHQKAFSTDRYVSAHRYLEPNDETNQLLALELQWDLGFAELTSATGFSKYETNGQRDQTDLLMDFEFGYEFFPEFTAYTREDGEEDTFNQELRLVSQGAERWNWIAGAFFNRFESDSSSAEFTPGIPEWYEELYGFPPGVPDLEYLSTADRTFEEMALFGELGYELTDRWAVMVGARWFDIDDELTIKTAFPFFEPTPGDVVLRGPTNKSSDSDFIFKFNTSYKFSDDMMGYLTVSEGYRNGGSNSGAPCEDPPQTFCLLPDELDYKPDTTLNYEVGLRSMWLGGDLVVNAALYFIDWDNVQVQARSVNGGLGVLRNGSTAESTGIELTTQWRITDSLQLAANVTLNESQLTSFSDNIVDGEDAFDGDRLAGTPEQQGTLVLAYTRPLDNGLSIEADYSLYAVSDVYTRVGLRNNGESLGGYAVHGLALGVTDGRWTARLYADNLFDKYAVTSVRRDQSYIREVGLFDSRTYFHSMLRPRTVGVEFGYRFDL